MMGLAGGSSFGSSSSKPWRFITRSTARIVHESQSSPASFIRLLTSLITCPRREWTHCVKAIRIPIGVKEPSRNFAVIGGRPYYSFKLFDIGPSPISGMLRLLKAYVLSLLLLLAWLTPNVEDSLSTWTGSGPSGSVSS